MTIRRRLPAQAEFDYKDIISAIQSVLGNVPISVSSNGIIELGVENITGAQAVALRAAVVAVLRPSPPDITA